MGNTCLFKIRKLRFIGFRVSWIRKHAIRADGEGNADTVSMQYHLEMRTDQAVNKVPCFFGYGTGPGSALERSDCRHPKDCFFLHCLERPPGHEEPMLNGPYPRFRSVNDGVFTVRMGHDAQAAGCSLLHNEQQLLPIEASAVTLPGSLRLTMPEAMTFIMPAPLRLSLRISDRISSLVSTGMPKFDPYPPFFQSAQPEETMTGTADRSADLSIMGIARFFVPASRTARTPASATA